MSGSDTAVWRRAAEALAASDPAALAALLPGLPAATAAELAAAVKRPGVPAAALPELPEGVEGMGDSRFLAIFARSRATVRWEQPGRELTTGCYLAPGDVAEFELEPGECRFILLRRTGGDA